MSTNPNELKQADGYLSQLVTWGVGLTFVGGVIITLGWPHTTIESFRAEWPRRGGEGQRGVAFARAAIFWAGHMLAIVG